MLLIYFLAVVFVLLTTLIQYKKISSLEIWLGILSLASKAAYLQIVITSNYVPDFYIEENILLTIGFLPIAFLNALIFISFFETPTRVQKKVAIKIPIIIVLTSYLFVGKYYQVFGTALVLLGLFLLVSRYNRLKISARSYFYFWLFSMGALFSSGFSELRNLSLFFEFISFFFYYKVIQQLMGKNLLWKKLNLNYSS